MYSIEDKNGGLTGYKKRDKMEQTSHKIIEKRRRDRINNCLAELSQTVPAAFAKQNVGKLEKAEILEMTVEYLRAIQTTELGIRFENGDWYSSDMWGDFMHHYQSGYSDCMKEIIRFMMDVESLDVSDARCARMMSYLQTRFRPDSSVVGGVAYRETSTRLAARLQTIPVQHPNNLQRTGYPHRQGVSPTSMQQCTTAGPIVRGSSQQPRCDSNAMLDGISVTPSTKLRIAGMSHSHLPNMYQHKPINIPNSGTTSETLNFGNPRWPPSLHGRDRQMGKLESSAGHFRKLLERHTERNS